MRFEPYKSSFQKLETKAGVKEKCFSKFTWFVNVVEKKQSKHLQLYPLSS